MAAEGSPILGMLAGCCLLAEGSADPPRDVTALVSLSASFPTWCRALLDVQSHPEGNRGFSICFLWCRPYQNFCGWGKGKAGPQQDPMMWWMGWNCVGNQPTGVLAKLNQKGSSAEASP